MLIARVLGVPREPVSEAREDGINWANRIKGTVGLAEIGIGIGRQRLPVRVFDFTDGNHSPPRKNLRKIFRAKISAAPLLHHPHHIRPHYGCRRRARTRVDAREGEKEDLKDIDRIAEVLTRLESSRSDANHFTKWDRQFHQLLADATHNPLMASVFRHINHVRGHAQWNAMKDKILTADRIKGYNRQHRDLYQALRTRDGEAAIRIITRHLRDARRDLLAT